MRIHVNLHVYICMPETNTREDFNCVAKQLGMLRTDVDLRQSSRWHAVYSHEQVNTINKYNMPDKQIHIYIYTHG